MQIEITNPIALAVVAVICVVAALLVIRHTLRVRSELKSVIAQFMEAGAARNVEAAYVCCSHHYPTREDVVDLIERSCGVFRDYKRFTISVQQWHADKNTTEAYVAGAIIYTDSRKQPFKFSLMKENDSWKIAGVQIGPAEKGVVRKVVVERGRDDSDDLKRPKAAATAESQPGGNLFHDRSLWLLLASNAVTILVAMLQNWDLLAVMRVYWFQSVVIGFFNFLRIRRLREFSTGGLRINGHPVEPTQKTKNRIARFFLLHYGFFHLGYFMFLRGVSSTDLKYVLPVALLFLGNHLYSHFYNRPRDTGRQNIGTLMAYPYVRIIPMHLTIVLGFFISSPLLFFLLLKTLADAIMHVVEHRVLLKRRQQQP
jgi:hypothetical protein